MMLRLNQTEIKKEFFFILSFKYILYIILLFKVNFILYYFNKKLSINLSNISLEFIKYNDDIDIFYKVLFKIENDIVIFLNIFTQKYFFFIVIGMILLFAMFGSIALCLKKHN